MLVVVVVVGVAVGFGADDFLMGAFFKQPTE